MSEPEVMSIGLALFERWLRCPYYRHPSDTSELHIISIRHSLWSSYPHYERSRPNRGYTCPLFSRSLHCSDNVYADAIAQSSCLSAKGKALVPTTVSFTGRCGCRSKQARSLRQSFAASWGCTSIPQPRLGTSRRALFPVPLIIVCLT